MEGGLTATTGRGLDRSLARYENECFTLESSSSKTRQQYSSSTGTGSVSMRGETDGTNCTFP